MTASSRYILRMNELNANHTMSTSTTQRVLLQKQSVLQGWETVTVKQVGKNDLKDR